MATANLFKESKLQRVLVPDGNYSNGLIRYSKAPIDLLEIALANGERELYISTSGVGECGRDIDIFNVDERIVRQARSTWGGEQTQNFILHRKMGDWANDNTIFGMNDFGFI